MGLGLVRRGAGWVLTEGECNESAFAHLMMRETTEIRGESVNALAKLLAEYFLEVIKGDRIEAALPCVLQGPTEMEGLNRRIYAVQKALREVL